MSAELRSFGSECSASTGQRIAAITISSFKLHKGSHMTTKGRHHTHERNRTGCLAEAESGWVRLSSNTATSHYASPTDRALYVQITTGI